MDTYTGFMPNTTAVPQTYTPMQPYAVNSLQHMPMVSQPQNPLMSIVTQPQQTTIPQVYFTKMAWSQGDTAARAYQLAPGEKVYFMDSDAPFVYVREADMTGRPLPMETYQLVKKTGDDVPEKPKVDLSQFVKTDDIASFVKADDIKAIVAKAVEEQVNKKMSELTFKPAGNSK